MSQKKKVRPGRKAARSLPRKLLEGLEEADGLQRRQQWQRAHDLLALLNRQFPQREEVLGMLVNVAHQLKNYVSYQTACAGLIALRPNDAELVPMLGSAYLANGCPALALRTFRRFLARWPNDEDAGRVRTTVTELEATLASGAIHEAFPGDDALELAALHEEVQMLLAQGRYAKTREVADKLLHRVPQFAPALNNLSEAWFREGRFDQAIATSRRVLAFAPHNFHALANLTRYLCLAGRADEAQPVADRLRAVTASEPDAWLKKAEALTCLGDDQGVLDALHGAAQAPQAQTPDRDALLHHLGAVAAYRLGLEDEARQNWRVALQRVPGYELAQANLDDLDRPVGERNAPWAYSLPHWVTEKTVAGLVAAIKPTARGDRDRAISRHVQHFLETHPELVGLLPFLLERGDPPGREFALGTAVMAETPSMLAALRDFALSQRGTDKMRMEAAQAASKAGLLPTGPVRMWLEGEWREIIVMAFEVYFEAVHDLFTPQVAELAGEAIQALHDHDGVRAEQLFHKTLELDPDRPELLNNLAAALEAQGRIKEARALLHQIHESHPDYLFGRTGEARLSIDAGDLDRAEALLKPLLERRRLHNTEFAALCTAQIELFQARGDAEAARSWLDIWAGADPEHPGVASYRRRLSQPRERGAQAAWRSWSARRERS